MCQPCFDDYLESVAGRLKEVNFESGESSSPEDTADECAFCGSASPSLGCFVTAYPQKSKERAFHGRACADCEEKAISELLLK